MDMIAKIISIFTFVVIGLVVLFAWTTPEAFEIKPNMYGGENDQVCTDDCVVYVHDANEQIMCSYATPYTSLTSIHKYNCDGKEGTFYED